jgi:hypothetical protein
MQNPISNHVNALNRAYAHIDHAIDACNTKAECIALLDQIESQSESPYMDILYSYAHQILNEKLSLLN